MLPPKPKLFQAVALIGVMVGSMGALNAIGNLTLLSRSEYRVAATPGLEPQTEAEARVARRVRKKLEHVVERHRGMSVGLQLANAALSLLLLVGSLTLSSRRTWAHAVMLQALVASGLYELPAAAHDVWLSLEKMGALLKLPELSEAAVMAPVHDTLALTEFGSLVVGLVMMLGLTALRLAYYGTGVWYLRRRDVRAWFSVSRDL